MRFLNKSLKEIIKENVDIGERDMQWNTYNGLLWYCEHLQRGKKGLDCGEKGGDYDTNRVFAKPKAKKKGFDDEL
jgi:hypothetical protein